MKERNDLSALLDERGVHPVLRDLLLDIASERAVERSSKTDQQLALAAEPDAYAAVYVTTSMLSIALDPEDADPMAAAHGLSVEKKNPTTHYLRVSAEHLSDAHVADSVRKMVWIAFDRSERGPRWQPGDPDPQGQFGDICPVHHLAMGRNGVCDLCD